MNIYVGNLNYQTREEELDALFSNYGEVVSVKIMTDRDTGRSRGFAFIEMADDAAGKEAVSSLNEYEFKDRSLVVNEARPKTERPARNFNSNRGGGGGGGGYNRY
jgi:RNA recognition motif-containing protein